MINIAIIGLGQRGKATLQRLRHIPNAQVVTTCDRDRDWHEVLLDPTVQLIYICTPWQTHVEMAVQSMKAGKHVALEVPAAMSVSQCELLVRVSSWTGRHCIMLENCCYDTWHLGVREMVRQGMFGRITHLEGAYIHPVDGQWMKHQRQAHQGNPYPTHGLGPMCQLLDADDRLHYLVSLSTDDVGEGFHLNDTLIRTVKGVTLLLQYDTTTPRPYNRLQTVCGTLGYAQKYPLPTLVLPAADGTHTTLTGTEAEQEVERHIPPTFQSLISQGKHLGVENVMNYIMDRRLIDALDTGTLPLDMDVRQAALWSSITELSEISARHQGERVIIPEF